MSCFLYYIFELCTFVFSVSKIALNCFSFFYLNRWFIKNSLSTFTKIKRDIKSTYTLSTYTLSFSYSTYELHLIDYYKYRYLVDFKDIYIVWTKITKWIMSLPVFVKHICCYCDMLKFCGLKFNYYYFEKLLKHVFRTSKFHV